MKNKGKEKLKKKYSSPIVRNLVLKYFLALMGYAAVVVAFVLAMWILCASVIWQPDNSVYLALIFVKEHIFVFAGIVIAAGWILLTSYFISKPFGYLDEVIDAAESLAEPTSEPIALSAVMMHTENQLNRAREKALNNARIAKEAEQRKNDLVVYLAHDLKTPLTSVIGYLTLLRDENQISEELRKKYLGISLDKAEHLEDLINEFFEITRFNLSDITLEYSRVNLTRMLQQLTYEFRPMLLEKNLECRLEIPPDMMIKFDVNKMQRVFDNLLRNAVNYSFDNSIIHIAAKQVDGNLSISFANGGDTIPPEKLERIFQQFYRLDTARSSRSGGAGLGLSIAKEIVELHGGTLQAASENDIIEFTITLPIS